MRTFSTPMMQQYTAIKQQHPDCLLFFRLGDFYELFLEDAEIGAPILDIVLTKRPRGKDGHIPMAGVPYHAADAYIAKLVKAGYKIAMCEQLSEPDNRGIVERGVVRIITPGTILDEKTLNDKQHNHIVSLHFTEHYIGLAAADLSTGSFEVCELPYHASSVNQQLISQLARLRPSECLISPTAYNNPALLKLLKSQSGMNIFPLTSWDERIDDAHETLTEHFNVRSLRSFGIEDMKEAQRAAAALLSYLQHTQKNQLHHIRTITYTPSQEHVVLDHATVSNLELFTTIRDREERGSVIQVLDKTRTAMGGRLLRTWLGQPLRDEQSIRERLDTVAFFVTERELRETLKKHLSAIYDIERILSRMSVGIATSFDVINLKKSLTQGLAIHSLLPQDATKLLDRLSSTLSADIEEIVTLIDQTIVDDPPLDIKNGNFIKKGVNAKLDHLRTQTDKGKMHIAKLEHTERTRTGITSLKVKFNKVFGYYIEVSKPNIHLVPDTYTRKQTMVNAERFTTPELKQHEDTVLRHAEAIREIEHALFEQLIQSIIKRLERIQQAATTLATLDCLVTFAHLAEQHHYVRPTLTDSGEVTITEGRHPVVEQLSDEPFIPNTITLNTDDHQLLMITGPNMAGKSVFMRQVALIVLLTHIGSFVPATQATVSLVDHIFVRSGASDVIASGLSTFMVEMVETAHILHHATPRSLIIMDEIGRGTSTYDGISIAWAVAEHLVTQKSVQAKTLFATHYHELQDLEDVYPEKIKNYHMSVAEEQGHPVFLHTIQPGRASHSYAIAVATLAGIPDEVTNQAQNMLHSLEKRHAHRNDADDQKNVHNDAPDRHSTASTEIEQSLADIDLDALTPLEALNAIATLKKKFPPPPS